jgi:hypothetical protein
MKRLHLRFGYGGFQARPHDLEEFDQMCRSDPVPAA